MKVWQAYSAEHSARVKIIGTFESLDDAEKAAVLFNQLLNIEGAFPAKESPGLLTAIIEACRASDLHGFSRSDAEQLRLFRAIVAGGREIRVEADSAEIQALLKVMVRYGAKIEIFSRPPCSRKTT